MFDIRLYDSIESKRIAPIIKDIEANNLEDITLHIHSIGGSVIDGNHLFAKIKAQGKVTGIVEGLCASMATIILQACSVRKMTDNSLLMIHAPSSFVAGNAQELEEEIKLLKVIEEQFKAILTGRCGMSEEAANELMDGKDHWYTAKEAKEVGLIDEIVPAINATVYDKNRIVAMSRAGLQELMSETNKPKNKPNMINEQTKKALLAIEAMGISVSQTEDSNVIIVALADALKSERTAREVLEKKQQEEQDKAIQAMVNQAIVAKKIVATQAETYSHIGKTAGIGSLQAVLESMPIPTSIHGQVTGATGGEDRKNWTFAQWQEKDPKALEKMNKSNPEQFEALYKTHLENQ